MYKLTHRQFGSLVKRVTGNGVTRKGVTGFFLLFFCFFFPFVVVDLFFLFSLLLFEVKKKKVDIIGIWQGISHSLAKVTAFPEALFFPWVHFHGSTRSGIFF